MTVGRHIMCKMALKHILTTKTAYFHLPG